MGDTRFVEGDCNANFGSNQIPNLALTDNGNRGGILIQKFVQPNYGPVINDYPNMVMWNPCYDESTLVTN